MSEAELLAAALRKNAGPYAPVDEGAFQKWALQNQVPMSNDYNMRGFYQGLMNLNPRAVSAMNPNDQQMHYPDYWKLPNHRTFSTESQYYNPATMPQTPTWQGGQIPMRSAQGQESWMLRRPDGGVVSAESPWLNK